MRNLRYTVLLFAALSACKRHNLAQSKSNTTTKERAVADCWSGNRYVLFRATIKVMTDGEFVRRVAYDPTISMIKDSSGGHDSFPAMAFDVERSYMEQADNGYFLKFEGNGSKSRLMFEVSNDSLKRTYFLALDQHWQQSILGGFETAFDAETQGGGCISSEKIDQLRAVDHRVVSTDQN